MATVIRRYPLNDIALKELEDDLTNLWEAMGDTPVAFCEEMMKTAEESFNMWMSSSEVTPGRRAAITTTTNVQKGGGKYSATGTLTATGKTEHDDEYGDFNILMAVEFGAGIAAAGAANPHFTDLHYGPGSYDRHGHASDPNGWYYPTGEVDEKGKEIWRHTFGTPATMPMHRTIETMKQFAPNVLREVMYKWLT